MQSAKSREFPMKQLRMVLIFGFVTALELRREEPTFVESSATVAASIDA